MNDTFDDQPSGTPEASREAFDDPGKRNPDAVVADAEAILTAPDVESPTQAADAGTGLPAPVSDAEPPVPVEVDHGAMHVPGAAFLPSETTGSFEPTGSGTAVTPAAPDSEPVAVPDDAQSAREAAAGPDLPLFSELGLSEPIQRAIAEMGYLHPTPIQAQAIPVVLAGRDVLGVAQTGTGKTASFTLPLLDILSGSRARARMPRSLILEPTRELALQVAENFLLYGKYLKLNHALLIGGESMSEQKEALNRGVDVLIATPGRLLDLFERGGLLLTQTSTLVIDEADRMLDMGFIPDVERIVSLLSPSRQTLFFSATMAPEIRRLSDVFLNNPKEITVSRAASVATTIEEGLVVVPEEDKRRTLRRMLRNEEVLNALIFCNRKRDVDILFKSLKKHGFSAGALHGDLPQPVRFATLEKFKAGELQLLVCSDVAARGIDIGGLSHVFNFDVPIHAEDYVHRIGRTGRAGRTGHALGIASPYDRLAVEAIEKLTGHVIPRIAIDGVESVEWAEDSRTRGGRGRGRGGSKPPVSRQDGPRPEGAQAGTGSGSARPETTRPEGARRRPEPSTPETVAPRPPQDRDRARGARPDVARSDVARSDAPRSGTRQDPPRPASPPLRDAARGHARGHDRQGAADEAVTFTGFGDDAPAFMLLPRRGARPIEAASETDSDDLQFND